MNFSELTDRLASINFSEELNSVEKEFGEEYLEILGSAKKKTSRMRNLVKKFPQMEANLMIIEGQGGTGKTYNVEDVLKKDLHMREDEGEGGDYVIWGSKMDATELYKLAYDHPNAGQILVFDDCDSVLGPGIINNLMKHLTDSYTVRKMSYTNQAMQEQGYKPEFKYAGKIIVLTNKTLNPANNMDHQALVSRAIRNSLPFTNMEKVINAIHLMFVNNEKYRVDAEYKRRVNFCARFIWLNRKYFSNDNFSARAAKGIPDVLLGADDDPNDFVKQIQIQDYWKQPNDAKFHTRDNG